MKCALTVRRRGDAVDGLACEMKAVEFIEHGHIERGGRGAFFAVTVDVEVRMIRAFVGQDDE